LPEGLMEFDVCRCRVVVVNSELLFLKITVRFHYKTTLGIEKFNLIMKCIKHEVSPKQRTSKRIGQPNSKFFFYRVYL